MMSVRILVLVLAACLPVLSSAQYRWVDKNGRTVFSDQPPPADVPAANIVRQPGRKGAAVEAAPAPAAAASKPAQAASGAVAAVKPSGKDKELQEKKKQAEAAQEEKKKAHELELARVHAENCKRARLSKAGLDSGARIARTNERGEREFLDDGERAAEAQRLEQVIASECQGG